MHPATSQVLAFEFFNEIIEGIINQVVNPQNESTIPVVLPKNSRKTAPV